MKRAWWRGPTDPVLRAVRLLVIALWPTVWVWVLPGQHAAGHGLVLAWVLVAIYSVAAIAILAAGHRTAQVLPFCLPLFAVAATVGAYAGDQREMALLVPFFLGILSVIAAMRFTPRQTWVQVGVATVAGLACVAGVVDDVTAFVATAVALVAGMSTPPLAILRLRRQLDAARASEQHLARIDPLTGALNRRGLFESAGDLLNEAAQIDIVTLDMDAFKQLNDTHGHAVGDEVLRRITVNLQALQDDDLAPAPVFVARLGGEEFLVLAAAGPRPVAHLAEAVRQAASVASSVGGRTSASVGAVRRRPPNEPEERLAWLMRQIDASDELMYRAKRSGGDRVHTEPAEASRTLG